MLWDVSKRTYQAPLHVEGLSLDVGLGFLQDLHLILIAGQGGHWLLLCTLLGRRLRGNSERKKKGESMGLFYVKQKLLRGHTKTTRRAKATRKKRKQTHDTRVYFSANVPFCVGSCKRVSDTEREGEKQPLLPSAPRTNVDKPPEHYVELLKVI